MSASLHWASLFIFEVFQVAAIHNCTEIRQAALNLVGWWELEGEGSAGAFGEFVSVEFRAEDWEDLANVQGCDKDWLRLSGLRAAGS